MIRSVIVFALDTGLFDGESLVVYPAAPASSVRIPLKPPVNTGAVLRLQVLVSALASSTQCHVFEQQCTVRAAVRWCHVVASHAPSLACCAAAR